MVNGGWLRIIQLLKLDYGSSVEDGQLLVSVDQYFAAPSFAAVVNPSLCHYVVSVHN